MDDIQWQQAGSKPVRMLICGGRDFADELRMDNFLDQFWMPRGSVVIVGCAQGADRMGEDWALHNGLHVERYPADWRTFGLSAGPRRNQRMLDEGKPEIVVAFPGGRGTADMVKRAKAAGVKVVFG